MEGREDPVPPGPLHALAQGLRELRTRAPGSPSYEELAARAGWPAAALADAASGSYLPTLEVTLAYVAACGGDVEEWRERWSRLHAALRAPDVNPATVELPPVPAGGIEPAEPVTELLEPVGAEPPEPAGLPGTAERLALAEHLEPDGSVAPERVAPLQRDDPRRLGPYRLLGRLGEGVMGRVYLGASRARRPVAVRLVPADRIPDRTFRSRFAAELSAARRVRSPHTPPVLDADPWAEEPWVATAYLPGPTLGEAIAAEGPLPGRLVWALAAAVAEALHAHHAVGVRHGALSPGNVLLTTDGPKVLDFGLARVGEAPRPPVRAASWNGGLPFLSPEQVEGRAATSAADVFSLGALLAYAATGVPPFGDDSTGGVLQRIARTTPLPAVLAIEDLNLRGLIIACLDKDPFRRPTPEEIANTCADHGMRANRLPPVLASRVARNDAEVSGILAEAARQRTLARLKYGAAPALLAVVVALSAVVAGHGTAGRKTAGAAGSARPTATAPPSPVIGSATSAPPQGTPPSATVTASGSMTAVAGASGGARPSGGASRTAGASGGTGCQGVTCNGKDPFATGCSGDGVVLYSLGTTAGVLEEWYSPTCQASWARIHDTSPGTWFYVQTCYSHYLQVFTVRPGFNAGYTFMVPGGGPTIRIGDVYGHGPC